VPWWWLLAGVVVVAVALLVWQPWDGAATEAAPTGSPTPSATEPVIEPSLLPPLPSLGPSPSLSSTSNVEPGPTPPGQDTVFDATSSQALFATADQIAGALPTTVGTIVPSTAPAPGWGLPANASIQPATCLVARTVVAQPPTAYAVRDWTGGTAFTFRQEVTLLASPVEAQRAFATLVGTVDACASYTVVDPTGTAAGRWVTQPAIEGAGLYPSIVQQLTVQGQSATTNGYRGHLLVGNAILTWTASTTDAVGSLGPPDGLSALAQDRALAAVQAAR
jgi:hypothetical protein